MAEHISAAREPRCAGDSSCRGVAISEDGLCLGHAPTSSRRLALAIIKAGDPDLNCLAGVRVVAELWDDVLGALTRVDGRPLIFNADFRGTVFESEAKFTRAEFRGDANFTGAVFEGGADFTEAVFLDGDALFGGAAFAAQPAWFSGAEFHGRAVFSRARFAGETWFDGAEFLGGTGWFEEARFEGRSTNFNSAEFTGGSAAFNHARIGGDIAWFDRTLFSGGDAWFQDTVFDATTVVFKQAQFTGGNAYFARSTFSGPDVWFAGTQFVGGRAVFDDVESAGRRLIFDGAHFKETRRLGLLHIKGTVWFTRSVFEERVDLAIRGGRLVTRQAEFRRGTVIEACSTWVELYDTVFRAPSRLTGPEERDGEASSQARDVSGDPRLASLRAADVSELVIGDVDVRLCRFAGCHNLDRVRFEQHPALTSPPGVRSNRGVVADEWVWRSVHSRRRASWVLPDHVSWPTVTPPEGDAPDAQQVAQVYRSLRKALEDQKNSPGAADFYYGEMEMRRRSGPPAERALLSAYWLASGYGLRASRALGLFAVLIIVCGFMFNVEGLVNGRSAFADDGFRAALLSSTALFRSSGLVLNETGEWLQVLLRFTGPILLGLAALALRARIKR